MSNVKMSNPRMSNDQMSDLKMSTSINWMLNPRMSDVKMFNPRMSNDKMSTPRISNTLCNEQQLAFERSELTRFKCLALDWSVQEWSCDTTIHSSLCATSLCEGSMNKNWGRHSWHPWGWRVSSLLQSNMVGRPLCTENLEPSPARGSENQQSFGEMAQPPKENSEKTTP